MVTWISPAYPEQVCAVEGCDEQGRRQICPFDGKYHRHGRIHYTNAYGYPEMFGFRFLEGDGLWHEVCDTHMTAIKKALELDRAARKAIDTLNAYLS